MIDWKLLFIQIFVPQFFLDQWNSEWEFNWNPALPCDTSHLTYYRISWARKSILYFRPFHRKSSRRKYFGVLATCLIWGSGKIIWNYIVCSSHSYWVTDKSLISYSQTDRQTSIPNLLELQRPRKVKMHGRIYRGISCGI